MKKRFVLIGLILAAAASASDFPELKGWKPEGETVVYHPGDLWKYINGAAEQYLSFGFEELMFRDLSRKDLVVTVHIYDMGTPLNAYGIYTSERPGETERHAVGGEAVLLPPYQCLLLKGTYYVKIDAYEGEIDDATGMELVTAVAEALPGPDGLPAELQKLPDTNKVDGSERYVRESFLGLGELKQCIYAKYRDEDEEFQRFIIHFDSDVTPEAAGEILGERWEQKQWKGKQLFFREVPYRGVVGIIYTEDGWMGVADSETEEKMLARFEELDR